MKGNLGLVGSVDSNLEADSDEEGNSMNRFSNASIKKIDVDKKLINGELKAIRAIKLFEYIEYCERQEKEEKFAILSAQVAIQRKILEERTVKLNNKMQKERLEAQQKKSLALAEKRKILLQIGRAKNDKSYGAAETKLIETEEVNFFKSKFYEDQAHEMKAIRTKIKEKQKGFQLRRAELFANFSLKKEVNIKSHNDEKAKEPDMENELDLIIKKYTRPDSPVNIAQRSHKKISSLEISRKVKADVTKRMQDNLKKNKLKSKQMTSVALNQYGISDFQEATKHARTLEDPLWIFNKPDVSIDSLSIKEPMEFILRSNKYSKVVGGKKSLDILDHEEDKEDEEPTSTTVEDEGASTKEKIVKENRMMSEEDNLILQRTNYMIKQNTRFVQFRPKTKSDPQQVPVPDLEVQNKLLNEEQKELPQDKVLHPIQNEHLIKSDSKASSSSNRSDKSLLAKFSGQRRLSILQDTKKEFKTKKNSLIPEDMNSSSQRRPSIYPETAYIQLENPFAGNQKITKTEDEHATSLSNWLQKVHNNEPIIIKKSAEKWPAISLESVAEFGKTLYPKKMLYLANAAESEEKIAKSKYTRPRYSKKSINLGDYFTNRFEQDGDRSAFSQMPIKGEKMKYWPTKLKYNEDGESEQMEKL